MPHRDSMDYFRRRELAERAAAKRAVSNVARGVHQELAQNYAELIRQASLVSPPTEARG